ncbi:MAG: type IX secretion system membrane protein PorP/SprF [Saprospiraceae bacterium]|nr:type IX secretion system membrane protein PorP/SprF [Saprospiraceae bacterium]
MKGKLVLLFLFGIANLMQAQLIPVSYNLNNRELINVALPNTEKIKYPFNSSNELMLMHRSQWTGLDQGPRWSGLSYSYMIDDNARAGGSFYHESFGAVRTFFVSGHYAYGINLSKEHQLIGGANIRYNLNQINTSKSSIRNPGDPLLADNPSSSHLSFTPGICYIAVLTASDIVISLGASFHNAVGTSFSKVPTLTSVQALVVHGSFIRFLSRGYKDLSSFEMGFVHRRYSSISDDTHLYGKYSWKGRLSARPGFRFGTTEGIRLHALHLDIGVPIGNLVKWKNKSIDINYVFELPFAANPGAIGTTHEVSIIALF